MCYPNFTASKFVTISIFTNMKIHSIGFVSLRKRNSKSLLKLLLNRYANSLIVSVRDATLQSGTDHRLLFLESVIFHLECHSSQPYFEITNFIESYFYCAFPRERQPCHRPCPCMQSFVEFKAVCIFDKVVVSF